MAKLPVSTPKGNGVQIDNPLSDGENHDVSQDGTIGVAGPVKHGTVDELLRVYGVVLPGSIPESAAPPKPYSWHGVEEPTTGVVEEDGDAWHFSDIDGTGIPGAQLGVLNTILVWGDFANDASYALDRRTFIAQGCGCGGVGTCQAPDNLRVTFSSENESCLNGEIVDLVRNGDLWTGFAAVDCMGGNNVDVTITRIAVGEECVYSLSFGCGGTQGTSFAAVIEPTTDPFRLDFDEATEPTDCHPGTTVTAVVEETPTP